jgi:hypothetical protein
MAAPSSDQILKQLDDLYPTIKALNSTPPGTGVNIDRLEYWLKEIDEIYTGQTKDPTLEGVSFKKSYNDSTGLKGNDPMDFTVFMPWGGWSSDQVGNKSFPAPLQKAIMDVFSSLNSDTQAPFIDMASLKPDIEFFKESGEGANGKNVSVINTIIDFVNNFKDESKTPIIRFLIGDEDATRNRDAAAEWGRTLLTRLFWRNENSIWVPRITHPKAEIHFGFYNPDFKPG